jgi:hypothetical protein
VTRAWLDLLTWEGMAYWFMDDGHTNRVGEHRTGAGISTHSFSETEVRLMTTWLATRGLSSVVDEMTTDAGRTCWTLRFGVEAANALADKIRPFVPSCMAYKAPRTEAVTLVRCVGCGAMMPKGRRREGTLPSCGAAPCLSKRNNASRRARLCGSKASVSAPSGT